MSRRSLNLYQKKHPLAARIERWLQARVNAVLGNSRAILRELREEGVEESRLGLIYNGVDLAPFDTLPTKQSVRASLGKSETALVLIVVANLIAYKGHADLLRALATIAGKLPEDWVLLCVGRDDGIGKALREQASDLGLEEHIVWMGERQDVPHVLHAADIGIMCSHEEGLSNSLLEGMAAGLPMVVTDVGGNRESVSDEITGLLVPPRDPIALGRAILDLAWAKPKRIAMGRAGRQHVETEFGIDSCVTQHERLYEGLVEGLSGTVSEILDSRY